MTDQQLAKINEQLDSLHEFDIIAFDRADIAALVSEVEELKGVLADALLDSTAYQLGIAEGRKQILDAAIDQANREMSWTELDVFIKRME